MDNDRRKFLALTGLSGLSLLGSSIVPGYAATQTDIQKQSGKQTPGEKNSVIPKGPLDPAPEWLQNADMITAPSWYTTVDKPDVKNDVWRGYDIDFKDVRVEKIVRLASGNGLKRVTDQILIVKNGTFDGASIQGVPLVSHVPVSEVAFKQAHQQGFRVIPYVHFTDIHTVYADQDIFPFQHPEVLLRSEDGKWVHLPMDGTDRFYRFLICTNNPTYCKLSLAYIKKIMAWGADGLFIDNVGRRHECFAPNFTKHDPEFAPYVHEHLFPENTNDYAFDRFLESVYKSVKSYGSDKIVLLNSGIGTEFQKNGDCCMWESFIYSWAWKGRRPEDSWEKIQERAAQNEWYSKAGRRITALSTIDRTRTEAKDDAFWAFSAARLVGFIWWAHLKGTGAEMLYKVHLGKALSPLKNENGISSRVYEHGLVALNDSTVDRTFELTLPDSFQQGRVLDIYNGSKSIPIRDKKVKLSVPANSARVHVSALG
jgi:hypothetical protein